MLEGRLELLVHQAVNDRVEDRIEVMKPLGDHDCHYIYRAGAEIHRNIVNNVKLVEC